MIMEYCLNSANQNCLNFLNVNIPKISDIWTFLNPFVHSAFDTEHPSLYKKKIK